MGTSVDAPEVQAMVAGSFIKGPGEEEEGLLFRPPTLVKSLLSFSRIL